MIRSRYELKYRITESQAVAIAEAIRPYMRPDRHSANGCYPLVSLYLDTQGLRLCRESMEGLKSRFKLRIRSYSDDPESPCFFEIKRRINQVIVKSRSLVPKHDVAACFEPAAKYPAIEGKNRENLEQFLYYQKCLLAVPMMRVRYDRQAFVSRCEDDVRVTFDRRISLNVTRTPELGLSGYGWHALPRQGVVLEIKFMHSYPAWVGRLVCEFNLQPQSMSKYARTVIYASAGRMLAVHQAAAGERCVPEPAHLSVSGARADAPAEDVLAEAMHRNEQEFYSSATSPAGWLRHDMPQEANR